MSLSKKSFSHFYLFLFLTVVLGVQSCQEPITVGSDILDDERIDLGTIDTLKVSSKTIAGDKVVTYRLGVNSRTYLVGQLNDPVFGKTDATLYILPTIQTTKPSFVGAILDSMVLGLTLDTLGTFGQAISAHKIEVYQLLERLRTTDTIYGDKQYPYGPLVGTTSATIRPKDSIFVTNHITRKSTRYIPHVRIPIDKSFAQSLFDNADANAVDTLFSNLIKGMAIKSTPISGPSMIGFNFTDVAISADNPGNKLNVYYHKLVKNETTGLDTMQRLEYQYLLLGNTVANYTLDRSGSIAQTYIDNPEKGNDLTLIQGLGGVKTLISFDNLAPLKDKLVTKVEIDVFVGAIPGQNANVAAPAQLLANRYNSEGQLELIPDILQLVQRQLPFGAVFGGQLDKSKEVYKYTINVTNHVKQILKDPSYRPELVLGILTESESAAQAVLYGAKHATYPMKIRVSYSKN